MNTAIGIGEGVQEALYYHDRYSTWQFLICSMAQDGTHQLRSAQNLRVNTVFIRFLDPPPGLYMALGALYGLIYGLGAL